MLIITQFYFTKDIKSVKHLCFNFIICNQNKNIQTNAYVNSIANVKM
jgi:hypothetical protein